MEIRKLNGALGAELEGVHLETIDDAAFKELADALVDHQVVFLRDQHLSEDGQRRLAERFGTPSVFPLARHFGGTNILGQIEDDAERRPSADGWHTDITWIEAPPKVAILCGLDMPAQIINGRMMVPLRAIGDMFHKNVQWYPNGRIVNIQ